MHLKNRLYYINYAQKAYWKKALAFILIFVAFLTALNSLSALVKDNFYYFTAPITNIFLKAGKNSSGFLASFFESGALQEENNALKKENQQLWSEVVLLRSELKKDRLTKEALENQTINSFKTVLAQTVGVDTSSDTLIIDKGQNQGVFENMPLVLANGVLYGKVLKSYDNFSQVSLISGQSSVLDVKVSLESDSENQEIYGVVRGEGGFSGFLDLVEFQDEIKEQDVLVTSALGGEFPKNLLVGKIISVNKNDLKPFQTAEIDLFLDIKNIENLFVITNYLR